MSSAAGHTPQAIATGDSDGYRAEDEASAMSGTICKVAAMMTSHSLGNAAGRGFVSGPSWGAPDLLEEQEVAR